MRRRPLPSPPRHKEAERAPAPTGLLALISSLFPNPEMNKIMATVHWSGRNQITQPTYS